jgi:pimeloyl-ACP methyl ester carboxylesterase
MQQRIDVGGYSLCMQMLGEGTPTVVLETGSCWSGIEGWRKVMPGVAQFTRVLTYDRAGMGDSDKAPTPRAWQDMVRDLRALLDAGQISGPFVLAGASVGGILVRLFAQQYPGDVAGMVSVDGTHPGKSFGYLKLLPPPTPDDSPMLRDFRRWFTIQTGGEPGVHVEDTECVDWQESLPAALALGSLGAMPLIVLTAGVPAVAANTLGLPAGLGAAMHETWLASQRDLATLSTNSTHIVVEDSPHMISSVRPDVVIDAIRRVVEVVRLPH